MKINAMVVCVNYSDFLVHSLDRWLRGVNSLTVVTDFNDVKTLDLIERIKFNPETPEGEKLWIHITDAFYKKGAKFNKGAAIEEARRAMPSERWADWFLFFDADIVPQRNWFDVLVQQRPEPGKLYGAWRYQADAPELIDRAENRIPDALCDGGYFHLFHTSDARANSGAQQEPLIETCWGHAGVYDSHFKKRWPVENRALSPVQLWHLGERENWTGRGDTEGMKQLLRERRRHGGSYEHERIG